MQEENNLNQLPVQVPAKRVRLVREKISQHEIDDAKKRYERLVQSSIDSARQAIELGEIFERMKARMRHGKWTPFVERTLGIPMRTVQRCMKAAELKGRLILGQDPAEFMAGIWGNEPKQLEAGKEDKKGKNDVTSHLADDDSDDDDEEEDTSQHGGPGFGSLFPADKGKAGFFTFKNLATMFEQFFASRDYTLEAKLTVITELIAYFEKRRKTLSLSMQKDAQAEEKAEQEQ